MILNLLIASIWLLSACGSALHGQPPVSIAQATRIGTAATLTIGWAGGAAPRQQVPMPGNTPRQPTKPLPPPLPARTAELPEDITLNSICLLDNVYGTPVLFQAAMPGSTSQPLSYLDKTVVDVPPNTTKPIIFSIWLKNNQGSLIRCRLSRGGSYQIFIKKNTHQLAVAPVVGG